MLINPKIQNTAFNMPPYIYLCIKHLPSLNYLRTFCINYFYNFLYVFYLQHISICSFCNSYLRNNINNSYKYLPCCSNKYIFLICKNKFDQMCHPDVSFYNKQEPKAIK